MPDPAAKTPIRLKVLGVFLIIVMIIVIGATLLASRDSRVVRSASGQIIKLERYEFQRGRVEYELPNRSIVRALAKVLPDGLKERIKWFKPERDYVIVTSPFRNEPLLSAAFSSRAASGKLERAGTRLVISDDHGQMFDPVVNDMMGGVFEAWAFPRRGKELRLHLMSGVESLAEFKIPNPCPGAHPIWKASPLPLAAANGELEITSNPHFDRRVIGSSGMVRANAGGGGGGRHATVTFVTQL